MITRIAEERVRILNDASVRAGDYILYWMQSSHRTEENPALQYAIERADQAHLPLIVYFGLWQSYPEANLRHFRFMLEGLAEVGPSLEARGIRFVLMIEPPDKGVCSLAKRAALAIVDRGYLRQQQSWYRTVAKQCRCLLVQVEGNVVVPVEVASQKEEYSAATFRPKINRLLDRFLQPAETGIPQRSSLSLDLPTLADESKGDSPLLPERPGGCASHKRGLSPFPRRNGSRSSPSCGRFTTGSSGRSFAPFRAWPR